MTLFGGLKLEPWVVATPGLRARLAERTLGFHRTELAWHDPTRRASQALLDQLERFDELTFGPHGLRMPRWAFYDCAELPGAVFGFSGSPAALPDKTRSLLPEATETFPFSMCMATPMVTAGEWLIYSISSLFELTPGEDAVELGVETLALALGALSPRRVHGTMQWRSPSLAAHARFAPLEVRSAWVPAHTHAATCVFAFDVDAARIERALAGGTAEGEGAFSIDPEDHLGLERLQVRLEAGARLDVCGVDDAGSAQARWRTP